MLVCPKCRSVKFHTIDTRNTKVSYEGLYRRRECLNCGERWTTYEIYATALDIPEAEEKKEKEKEKAVDAEIVDAKSKGGENPWKPRFTSKYKSDAIRTAKQLGYSPTVVRKLLHADSDEEVERIMVTARKQWISKEMI